MSSDRAAVAGVGVAEEHATALRQVLRSIEEEAKATGRWAYYTTGWAGNRLNELLTAIDPSTSPAPETVTVNLGTEILYLRDDELWIDSSCAIVAFPKTRMSCALSRIASDARALAELRDENTQLKREVDWITERASSARIAANTFERERDRATADRDAGLRVLAEREARIAELEKANAQYLVELNAFNTRIAELDKDRVALLACVNNQLYNITTLQSERDAALRALEEAERRAAEAPLAANTSAPLGRLYLGVAGASTVPQEPKERAGATVAPECRDMATAPAPIPLGAVVEFDGRKYRYTEDHMWQRDGEKAWHGDRQALDALYRAIHPVATRETVERVALDAWRDVGKVELRHVRQIVDHTYKAAGFTLEGA